MKKALVFFFAVVIGLSFAFTGFAQDKKATPAPAPVKVEQQAATDEKPAVPEKTKKKKIKKTKKAKKQEEKKSTEEAK